MTTMHHRPMQSRKAWTALQSCSYRYIPSNSSLQCRDSLHRLGHCALPLEPRACMATGVDIGRVAYHFDDASHVKETS